MTLARSELQSRVLQFKEAMTAGLEGIAEASRVYVNTIDAHPELEKEFKAQCQGFVPASAWKRLEDIGRRRVHPRLVLGGVEDMDKHSRVSQLPYDTQEQIMKRKKLSVLTDEGTIERKDVFEMTRTEVARAIGGGVIRKVPEQRKYLEEQKERKNDLPYYIEGGVAFFKRGARLTKVQVEKLLKDMG